MKPYKKNRACVTSRVSRRLSGFGLMEILIAMAVGLVAMVVVAQTFALSEGQRRTTVGGSDAHQSAMVTMSLLEAGLLNAGMNITTTYEPYSYKLIANTTTGTTRVDGEPPSHPNFLIGCNARYGADGPYLMAPVRLTAGGGAGVPDQVHIVAGGNTIAGGGAPVPVNGSIPAGETNFRIMNGTGFRVGDWVVLVEQDGHALDSHVLAKDCSLARIAALPDLGASPLPLVQIDRGTIAAYTVPWLFNLGQNPTMNTYRVENGRLIVSDMLGRRADAVLAEGVVNLKAQYGIDVNHDDSIDLWSNAPLALQPPLNSPAAFEVVPVPPARLALPPAAGVRTFNQVKAVRLGLTMRSNQAERPGASGTCDRMPASLGPLLPEENNNQTVTGVPDKPSSGDVAVPTDVRCFRHYSHVTVVPIHNMIWSDL